MITTAITGDIMELWQQIFKTLTAPNISPRLEDRIHKQILVDAEKFTPDTADNFKEGTELFGHLFMAHRDFTKNRPFEDMFAEHITLEESNNKGSGQFFTPWHICSFMTEMTLSDLDLTKMQKIGDPAAGTGRFMLATAKHYAEKIKMFNFIFVNVDIEFRAYVFCSMNAILNGIPSATFWGDSLMDRYTEGIVVMPQFGLPMWKRVTDKEIINRFVIPMKAETVNTPLTFKEPKASLKGVNPKLFDFL
jgi:type I restriction-modification system DNA methylase subunit